MVAEHCTTMEKLEVAGAFSGSLEVDISDWTVLMLRDEIARRLHCEPTEINLSCGGQVMRDGVEKLCDLGINNDSNILVSKFTSHDAEEDQSCLLDPIKSAATALTDRHAEVHFNIELEAQNGQKNFGANETYLLNQGTGEKVLSSTIDDLNNDDKDFTQKREIKESSTGDDMQCAIQRLMYKAQCIRNISMIGHVGYGLVDFVWRRGCLVSWSLELGVES